MVETVSREGKMVHRIKVKKPPAHPVVNKNNESPVKTSKV